MRSLVLPLLVLAALAALTGLARAQDAAATILYTVTDAAGKPLAGAEVGVWNDEELFSAETDERGLGRLAGVPPGSYTAWVGAEGFVTKEKAVRLAAGERALEFSLPLGTSFDGRVVDGAGRPIEDAYVEVLPGGTFEGYSEMFADQTPHERTWTDGEGRFHVRGIPPGQVATVVVLAEGFETARVGVRDRDGRVRPVDLLITLARGGGVQVAVRDPEGKPVSGALVFVVPADAEMLRRNPRIISTSSSGGTLQAVAESTDGAGVATVGGLLRDEEYVALVEARGFARTESATFTPTRKEPAPTVTVTLRRPGTLLLRLVGPDGTPVADAEVEVGGSMSGWAAKSGSPPGTWRFDLPPGSYRVSIDAEVFLDQDLEVAVAEGEVTERTVTLSAGVEISGVLVDRAGKPVPGILVEVERTEGDDTGWHPLTAARSETDAKGRFTLGGLRPGKHELTAYGRNFGLPAKIPVTAPAKDLRVVGGWGGIVTFRLAVPEGAEMPEDVSYWRHDADGGGSGSSQDVAADGTVEFIGFFGPERLSIRAEGYVPLAWDLEVGPGERKDLGTLALDPGLDVTGVVVDRQGAPVAGAEVSWGEFSDVAVTDDQGRFTMRHLAPGGIDVGVGAEGFVPLEAKVATGTAARLVIARGEVVRGVAVDPEGKPLGEHWIQIRTPAADGTWEQADVFETDEDGTFEVRVAPGPTRLVFRRFSDSEPVTLAEFEAEEGGARRVTLTIR